MAAPFGLMSMMKGGLGSMGLIGSLLDHNKKNKDIPDGANSQRPRYGAGSQLLAPKSMSGFDRPRDPLAM